MWFSRWSPWYPKRQSSSWNPPGNPCFIACTGWGAPKIAGWWFQTFFIVYDIWDNHPNWLSYFSEWLRPPTRYTHAIKFEATCLTKHVISPWLVWLVLLVFLGVVVGPPTSDDSHSQIELWTKYPCWWVIVGGHVYIYIYTHIVTYICVYIYIYIYSIYIYTHYLVH